MQLPVQSTVAITGSSPPGPQGPNCNRETIAQIGWFQVLGYIPEDWTSRQEGFYQTKEKKKARRTIQGNVGRKNLLSSSGRTEKHPAHDDEGSPSNSSVRLRQAAQHRVQMAYAYLRFYSAQKSSKFHWKNDSKHALPRQDYATRYQPREASATPVHK
jgi:hypothetical protein